MICVLPIANIHTSDSLHCKELISVLCPFERVELVSGEYSNKSTAELHRRYQAQYGNIVRLSGMPGAKDNVYLFDPDDIEKVSPHYVN